MSRPKLPRDGPPLLVLDTSVLVDLERGGLVETAFRLPRRLAVPDLLYRRELEAHGGPALLRLGLRVEELDGAGVALAQGYFNADRAVSLADAFALALAKASGGTLLTGDAALRALAGAEGIACHGVLWLLDLMFDERAATAAALHRGLARIAAHPRTRLPRQEVNRRLQRFAGR